MRFVSAASLWALALRFARKLLHNLLIITTKKQTKERYNGTGESILCVGQFALYILMTSGNSDPPSESNTRPYSLTGRQTPSAPACHSPTFCVGASNRSSAPHTHRIRVLYQRWAPPPKKLKRSQSSMGCTKKGNWMPFQASSKTDTRKWYTPALVKVFMNLYKGINSNDAAVSSYRSYLDAEGSARLL